MIISCILAIVFLVFWFELGYSLADQLTNPNTIFCLGTIFGIWSQVLAKLIMNLVPPEEKEE